jgi:hypothetical protein
MGHWFASRGDHADGDGPRQTRIGPLGLKGQPMTIAYSLMTNDQ